MITNPTKTSFHLNLFAGFVLGFLMASNPLNSFSAESPTLQLAIQLSEDLLPKESAVEFRRLALETAIESEKDAYQWVTAFEYYKAELYEVSESSLDRADAGETFFAAETSLLRAEIAEQNYDLDTALFFLDSISQNEMSDGMKDYVERSQAALRLKSGDLKTAILFTEREDLTNILIDYQQIPMKKPWLGGLMGVIPGLGYAYSGEYANAVRSIILNSIFIYGMVDTAGDEEWGAFGVITFFEITWYTGSIYGGIDAAHRFNEEQLQGAINAIQGNSTFAPDYPSLPILQLNFTF